MQSPEHGRGSVLIASIAAIVIGTLIVLMAVLPAEYGVDPTGVGERLGLLQLAPTGAESSTAAAVESDAAGPSTDAGSDTDRGAEEITLGPGDGVEYKLEMLQGQQLTYRWLASGPLHVDLHGEPAGDTTGYYESYTVSSATAMEGKFTALFDGTHGWYWRNDGDAAVFIDLRFNGEYEGIKDMGNP